MSHLKKLKMEKLNKLIMEYNNFKLCGPSDDPDLQTNIVISFRHIVKSIQYYCKYIEDEELKRKILKIDPNFEEIYSVYEANSDLSPLISELYEYIQEESLSGYNTQNKNKVNCNLSPSSRARLINEIAYKLQQEMTTTEINIFLSGFDLNFKKEEVTQSKRVYVQNILVDVTNKILLEVANELELVKSSQIACSMELNVTDFNYIDEQINKCSIKLQNKDYEGAITNARSLLESICIHILDESNRKVDNNGSLIKLYKEVAKMLDMHPSKHSDDNLKQICSGFFSIINGLANLRNEMSDAHGKTKEKYYKPDYRHAALAINSSKTISEFLLNSWKSRQV